MKKPTVNTQPSMPLLTQRLHERNREALETMMANEANIKQGDLPALKRLVEVAKGNSHQPQYCRRVLLAVYNSYAWPLNLNSLRGLDDDLRRAAIAVIEWSAVSDRELYEYLPDGHQLMQRLAAIEKQEEQ